MSKRNLSEEDIKSLFMDLHVEITILGELARRRAERNGNHALAREVRQLDDQIPGFIYEGEKVGGASIIVCFPRVNDNDGDRLSFIHGNQSVREMAEQLENEESRGGLPIGFIMLATKRIGDAGLVNAFARPLTEPPGPYITAMLEEALATIRRSPDPRNWRRGDGQVSQQ